jgi:putative thioredoxin
MATTAIHVIDVNERDFASAVLERSKQLLVVVDFWAAWCGPCRVLGPVLERLAAEMNGGFLLAKIDVDQNQRLAAQFGVQGIPAVMAFRDGTIVDQFSGTRPETHLRAWLKKLIPSLVDQLVAEAQQLEHSDPLAATARYREVLRHDPEHGPSLLALGRMLTLQGDREASALLGKIRGGAKEYPAAQALLTLAEFLGNAQGSIGEAHQRIQRDPSDTAARWTLAALLTQQQQWEEALGELLTIVQRDRAFADDGARRMMLALFAALGDQHPLVGRYRQQLASYLF